MTAVLRALRGDVGVALAPKLALPALALCWSSSFFLYKILDRALDPVAVVAGRLAVAAAFLNLVAWSRGGLPVGLFRRWRALLVMGALNNVVPFWLFAWSERRISSGTASVLNATGPLLVCLIGLVQGETDQLRRQVVPLALGIAGVTLLASPSFDTNDMAQLPAIGACLLAVGCYSVATIYGGRFVKLSPMAAATGQTSMAALLAMPAGVAAASLHPVHIGVTEVAAFVAMGVVCTGCAYMLFFRLLAARGPVHVQKATLLIPVFGLGLGHVVLGEPVGGRTIAGALLVCLSFVLAPRCA